jgi:hypothetical protein
MRAGTEFFVVFLVTAEMADIEARMQGYENQCDRAFSRIVSRHTPAPV